MIKSAKAVDPAAEYVWKFSGSPIRIHVAISVISKLRQQLNSDTSVDPAQKKEIGGLLIGGIRDGRLAITDIEPLSLDPGQRHFILSDSQKESLKKSIAARQTGASSAIVGYYRSDVRTGIKLAEEDLVLIREFFRSPLDVFLVIRSDEEGKPKAGFFFWDAGSIFSDASFLEFPLDETLVSLTKRAESQPQAPPVPEPAVTKQTDKPVRTSFEVWRFAKNALRHTVDPDRSCNCLGRAALLAFDYPIGAASRNGEHRSDSGGLLAVIVVGFTCRESHHDHMGFEASRNVRSESCRFDHQRQ